MPTSPKENQILKVLKRVLDKHQISPKDYCLNGSAEECACLEKTRWFWNSFNVERGNEFDLERFTNLEDACLHLMGKLADSQEEMDLMVKEFKIELRILQRRNE